MLCMSAHFSPKVAMRRMDVRPSGAWHGTLSTDSVLRHISRPAYPGTVMHGMLHELSCSYGTLFWLFALFEAAYAHLKPHVAVRLKYEPTTLGRTISLPGTRKEHRLLRAVSIVEPIRDHIFKHLLEVT